LDISVTHQPTEHRVSAREYHATDHPGPETTGSYSEIASTKDMKSTQSVGSPQLRLPGFGLWGEYLSPCFVESGQQPTSRLTLFFSES